MNYELTLEEKEAVHDVVNLRLFPSPHLELGQVYRLNHGGSTVRIERIGTAFRYANFALSYRYLICGAEFSLLLLAVYPTAQAATAFVEPITINLNIIDDNRAFLTWLNKLITLERSPSDPFFDGVLFG